jgi:hypothetical protein
MHFMQTKQAVSCKTIELQVPTSDFSQRFLLKSYLCPQFALWVRQLQKDMINESFVADVACVAGTPRL